MKYFPESELIINPDGTAFHLHIKPEQLAEKVLLVGDPERVTLVASHFDTIECDVLNREFHTITGTYKGKRITAMSHGIGTDNIDIVLNELDALANIDFDTRTEKPDFRQLTLIRVGTSGGLQPFLKIGSFCIAVKSIGMDTVLHYYSGGNDIRDFEFESAFKSQTNWPVKLGAPYVVHADEELVSRFENVENMVKGVTISAIGFYAPQGRELRIPLAFPDLNKNIEAFRFEGDCITNYEMESSALASLAHLMGHKAVTVCTIIANRLTNEATPNYKSSVDDLIRIVLEKI
ncbi:nucleoside phosphorylase [Parabacteroides sp. FAFU027]|uniref:nucleoside phosphorylase n=1 Tax=Parabacteroides sp. FAFU027 TaxID=2922715 RepID=UPI001FAF0F20|nr:nucleoside phosphorylase [Parabacteroides sp. FAFU027]